MPIALLMLLAAPDEDLIVRYRARTRADAPCAAPTDPGEVTVCARRDADRYRVTFITPNVRDSVPTERARLLEPKVAGCGRVSAFFADCGFIGMTTTVGASGVKVKTRKLAD